MYSHRLTDTGRRDFKTDCRVDVLTQTDWYKKKTLQDRQSCWCTHTDWLIQEEYTSRQTVVLTYSHWLTDTGRRHFKTDCRVDILTQTDWYRKQRLQDRLLCWRTHRLTDTGRRHFKTDCCFDVLTDWLIQEEDTSRQSVVLTYSHWLTDTGRRHFKTDCSVDVLTQTDWYRKKTLQDRLLDNWGFSVWRCVD